MSCFLGFPKLKKRQKKNLMLGEGLPTQEMKIHLYIFPHIKMIVKKQGLARLLSRKKDWMIDRINL